MSLEFIEKISKDEHDTFDCNHPMQRLFQRSSWGDVKIEWNRFINGVFS